MDEPLDEFVRLYDFLTGNQIICSNGKNLKDRFWLQHFQTVNQTNTRNNLKYLLNVAEDVVPHLDESQTFSHDDMVGVGELQTRCKIIVQYSTYMHIFLSSNSGNFLISCLRGRSRSPCVILCFLILFRGFNTEIGMGYLKAAFHAQRPTMTKTSSNEGKYFPNLLRYLNIFSHIELLKQDFMLGVVTNANRWLLDTINNVWNKVCKVIPNMESNKNIMIPPMDCLKMKFESLWRKSRLMLQLSSSSMQPSEPKITTKTQTVVSNDNSESYKRMLKKILPSIPETSIFMPYAFGYNFDKFRKTNISFMILGVELKRQRKAPRIFSAENKLLVNKNNGGGGW